MKSNVYLFATLDTKGHEAAFVRDELKRRQVGVTLVDCGALGEAVVKADVSRETLFKMAGTSLAEVRTKGDRGEAVAAAASGAAALATKTFADGKLAGVISIGGSAGTTIGTAAMRALPLGVPKVMVSTLAASAQAGGFVGTSDIFMLNSVVDVSGINRISRVVLTRAAQAMAGMAQAKELKLPKSGRAERALIAATMFGVTTPCVERARMQLEKAGYEVLVFHATGAGGRTLEQLARDGLLAGVLDVTTTELADELVGGFLTAGRTRLTAAGAAGIPQVVSVGALDMVNFFGPDSVPARFAGRKFHRHNDHVTLMRTSAMENAQLGVEIGTKLGEAKGPRAIFLPLKGVSAIDKAGQPFDDPVARKSLYDNVKANCGDVPVVELDLHVNDEAFADAMVEKLLQLMGRPPKAKPANGAKAAKQKRAKIATAGRPKRRAKSTKRR